MKKRKNKHPKPKTNLTPKQIEHRKFIASKEWTAIKKKLFSIRERKCEKCNRKIGLQVHHLTYVRFGGDELIEDLQILCAYHHMLIHKLIKPKRNTNKRKKKPRKKPNKYHNILQIYPNIMDTELTRSQKAVVFNKIFNGKKKLVTKRGELKEVPCMRYLKKITQIYNVKKSKVESCEKIVPIYDDTDDCHDPCWHYTS